MKDHVIWDNFDNTIHRGPWTRQECDDWMHVAKTEIFPDAPKLDTMWEIRKIIFEKVT